MYDVDDEDDGLGADDFTRWPADDEATADVARRARMVPGSDFIDLDAGDRMVSYVSSGGRSGIGRGGIGRGRGTGRISPIHGLGLEQMAEAYHVRRDSREPRGFDEGGIDEITAELQESLLHSTGDDDDDDVAHGASVASTEHSLNDLLLMATRAGDARKVRELLAAGASPTKSDARTGQSALDLAKAHPLVNAPRGANNEVLTVLFEAALQEKGLETARRLVSGSSSSASTTRGRDVRPAMGPSGADAARGARGVVGPEGRRQRIKENNTRKETFSFGFESPGDDNASAQEREPLLNASAQEREPLLNASAQEREPLLNASVTSANGAISSTGASMREGNSAIGAAPGYRPLVGSVQSYTAQAGGGAGSLAARLAAERATETAASCGWPRALHAAPNPHGQWHAAAGDLAPGWQPRRRPHRDHPA